MTFSPLRFDNVLSCEVIFEIDNVACLKASSWPATNSAFPTIFFYALRLDGIFETIHAMIGVCV
jgi:hypothetical protein